LVRHVFSPDLKTRILSPPFSYISNLILQHWYVTLPLQKERLVVEDACGNSSPRIPHEILLSGSVGLLQHAVVSAQQSDPNKDN
jgi:hypothetical protein